MKFTVRTWKNGGGSFGAYITPIIPGESYPGHTYHHLNCYPTRRKARAAAFQIVRKLRSERLHIIEITKRDIREGIGRNCTDCPVANALYRQLPAMGFEDCYAEVVPYACCWADARGIEIRRRRYDPIATLSPHKFPHGLTEWTMDFDDWYDAQGMSLKDWRELHGYCDGERPNKPYPFKFLLNLDDFTGFIPETRKNCTDRNFPVDTKSQSSDCHTRKL